MHQALYRKWRPQTFDDVYGQEHITSVLRYEAEHQLFSHAYLFCGSRGTGKTTCAKILAKVVNCEHPVNGNPCGECDACRAIDSGASTDVLEMDAASNNGVDNIRDIRDEVVYTPSSLKYRVYIIDEVHMLSPSAFNALLKTLEEPPEHVIFVLATTELQKLPATIISRCQRFDFRRISTEDLSARLKYIAQQEKIKLTDDAVKMIARLAQGGMRDAISLLELCAGGNREVTVDVVSDAVGLTGREALIKTATAVAEKDFDSLFSQIDDVVKSAKDLSTFWQDLIGLYRDLLVVKTVKRFASYLDLSDHESAEIQALSKRFSKETLIYQTGLLEDAFFAMQKANAVKRTVAEMTLVRMCDDSLDDSGEAVLSRIAKLEEQITVGRYVATAKPIEEAPKKEKTAEKTPAEIPQKKVEIPKESDKRVLHTVKGWTEIVEKAAKTSPMVAGFLKNTKGLLDGNGKVFIRFDNDFAMEMVEKNGGRDKLRALVCASLQREVPDGDFIFEVREPAGGTSGLDEIIEASEE